ncbi:hypothetical protein Cgig2_031988 [Carnegiea gigantea]|uniref:Uncharacterized protein n=1 Tax=Carnegiea gigantea TaxID=171969 RepID=A0A9Q1GRE5_9CARY|nr:hypothetical protein Cgig2_010851 [Carnegiea gigantea]KAJ8426247.1 hypothetical protein Cgig2_031988 [Carnegiea gigantea]
MKWTFTEAKGKVLGWLILRRPQATKSSVSSSSSRYLKVHRAQVYAYALSKYYLLYIMSSSYSSNGDVQGSRAGPQVEGRHPQFPNLLALVDGRVVAEVLRQNKCREPKNIPYAIPIFEPGSPSWSSCEYSSTPSILNPEAEVTYPWEITIANYVPAFQSNAGAETASSSSSTPTQSGSPGSATSHSSRSSSSEGASTSASPPLSRRPSSSVLERKDRTPQVTEVVAEGFEFPGVPTRSDPQDGPGSHFSYPKAVAKLKRSALEKQELLPAEYSFVIPEPDATVNELPAKCIAIYRAALDYGIRFPLHPVTKEILNKYELAPTYIVPISWHNICSFIATCELRGLTYSARAFGLVHTVQKAPKETGGLGWYYFNNGSGFITAIEKKSKLKYWQYNFLFLRRE